MRFTKPIAILILCFFLSNCSTFIEGKSDNDPFLFKSKKQIEKNLKEKIDFEKLTFGVYETKKNFVSEKGLNLDFQINDFNKINDTLFIEYSDIIVKEIKTHLEDNSTHQFVKISFESETTQNEITKVNSFKIKKKLN